MNDAIYRLVAYAQFLYQFLVPIFARQKMKTRLLILLSEVD